MILGLCGNAGSGKDTIADFLVKNHGFVKVALADPLKRICKEVFDFTDEQLWGPSEKRNEPDLRYVRALGSHITTWNQERQTYNTEPTPEEDEYLTPRYALQQLGTEWGRDCYGNVWVDYALRVAKELLRRPNGEVLYTPQTGLVEVDNVKRRCKGVVISDVRFLNEVDAINKAWGTVWRIERPGAGLEGAAGQHASEQELLSIPGEKTPISIRNTGTLESLEHLVAVALQQTLGK